MKKMLIGFMCIICMVFVTAYGQLPLTVQPSRQISQDPVDITATTTIPYSNAIPLISALNIMFDAKSLLSSNHLYMIHAVIDEQNGDWYAISKFRNGTNITYGIFTNQSPKMSLRK